MMVNEANKISLYSLIKRIYQKHPNGGELHVILDDLNVEDSHIKRTLNYICNSDVHGEDRVLYTHCLARLLELSEKERIETIQQVYNEIDWNTVNFDD